jgi:hypothetical protein
VHFPVEGNQSLYREEILYDYPPHSLPCSCLNEEKTWFSLRKQVKRGEALMYSSMDQRSIYLFLAIKGLSAQVVDNKLVAVLGLDVIACSTVTKYLGQQQFPSIPCDLSEESPNIAIHNAILDVLEKQLFSSIRELAKLTCIPTATVHRHLTGSLGFAMRQFRCVPHGLTDTQKTQRLILSNKLLRKLRSIKHQD